MAMVSTESSVVSGAVPSPNGATAATEEAAAASSIGGRAEPQMEAVARSVPTPLENMSLPPTPPPGAAESSPVRPAASATRPMVSASRWMTATTSSSRRAAAASQSGSASSADSRYSICRLHDMWPMTAKGNVGQSAGSKERMVDMLALMLARHSCSASRRGMSMGRRAEGGVVVAVSPCCCAEGDRLVEVAVAGRGREDGNWLPYEVVVEIDVIMWKMAISPMRISVLYRWDCRTSGTKRLYCVS